MDGYRLMTATSFFVLSLFAFLIFMGCMMTYDALASAMGWPVLQ